MTATTVAPASASTGTSGVPGLTHVPLLKCVSPSGYEVEVLGTEEKRRYDDAKEHYMDEVTFTVRSDLEDLDRILFMELMVFRWSHWLMRGKEYDGTTVTNENELRRWVQDWNDRISKLKEQLKLDKRTREGDQAANFEQKWRQLSEHAMELGIVRNQQAVRAIEVMQGLFSIVGSFDRADEEERRRLGFPDESSVLQYIRDMKPVYDEIDEKFRATSQKYWIRQP